MAWCWILCCHMASLWVTSLMIVYIKCYGRFHEICSIIFSNYVTFHEILSCHFQWKWVICKNITKSVKAKETYLILSQHSWLPWTSISRAQYILIQVLQYIKTGTWRIMYVLEWRTVSALTRGLFWCLFPKLRSNEGNKYQNNTPVRAEMVHHESTYIISFLTWLTRIHKWL